MKKIYNIPEEKIIGFEKKIKYLNKRANKLNLPPIKTNIVATKMKECLIPYYIDGKQGYIKSIVKFFEIEVIGDITDIYIKDYKAVAIINHNKNSSGKWFNTITKIDDNLNIDLTNYYDNKPFCNHCNTNRNRKITVLIQHKNGNILQVGKSCLKEFISYEFLKTYEYLETINDFSNYETLTDLSKKYSYKYIKVENILNITFNYLEKNDFKSKSSCYFDGIPTSNIINDLYHKPNIQYGLHKNTKNCIEYFKNIDLSDNDYMNNLRSAYNLDYIDNSQFALIVASVNTYNRHLEYKERTKNNIDFTNSKFVEIPKRQDITLKYVKSFSFTGNYNGHEVVSYIHQFSDENNNCFVWKSSKCLDLKPFETCKMKVSFKSHEIYNNVEQTHITRCKIVG